MKKTLILFIDAVSYTDFNQKNCPFIYNLAKEGAYGPLETIPAGYHIEYSMLSGCLPLKHNIWTWYYLNPKGSFSSIKYIKPLIKSFDFFNLEKQKRMFIDVYLNLIRLFSGKTRFLKSNKIPVDFLQRLDITVDRMHFETNVLQVPNIFDVFKERGIKYVGMEFPILSDSKGTKFYFTKGDFKEIDKAIGLLKKYNIAYLHIWELDKLEHKYGLHSKESLTYIKKLDDKIKEILQKNKNLRIIIFSDHGGVKVTKTKNVLPILKDYDCDYFLGSTSVQVWLKGKDIERKDDLKKLFLNEGYLIYDEKNIEKELFIPYKREYVGDMIVWVKPGEQIYPDFFRDTAKVKSMHGYSKKVPELSGVFVMNGFGLGNKKIKGMKLYDIAPTILGAMDIPIPKIWDGKARI